MKITIEGNEVDIPSGNYGDEDDMLCRGCGAEVGCWHTHTVVDCLKHLRQQIEELKEEYSKLLIRNPVLGGKVEVKKEPCTHKVTHDTTSSDGRIWTVCNNCGDDIMLLAALKPKRKKGKVK